MRPLSLAIVLLWVPIAVRSETLREWLDAAPKADISFAPWTGDVPSVETNRQGFPSLPQGFYGYLDVSHLAATSFPVEVRLLYDAPLSDDAVITAPGSLTQLKDSDPVGSPPVVERIVIASPADGSAIPVWNAPLPLRHEDRFYPGESVRCEILDHAGTLLGRLPIGVSAPMLIRPRAVAVNSPEAYVAFAQGSYTHLAQVERLIPDSFAYVNVDAIWIDSATTHDPKLTDDFWMQVLLGGTTVAGHAADITTLQTRLGLEANEPALLGRLIAADSPQTFIREQGRPDPTSGAALITEGNDPFFFSIQVGAAMHRELLRFSEYYLGIFVILQIVIIVVAFLRFRGTRRVWLWLVVPGFAVIYAVAGVALAHSFVRARSDESLSQVELQRQGWSQSILFSDFQEISLAEGETVLDLPTGARPFVPGSGYYYVPNWPATFVFFHDADTGRLTVHAQPATHTELNIRSFHSAVSPFELLPDGKLRPGQVFTQAWFWDGANWHDLGQLFPNSNVDWKDAPVIRPRIASNNRLFWDGRQEDRFPAILKPLLTSSSLQALSAAGDGLFLGIQSFEDRWAPDAARVQIKVGAADRIASRHIVAYQFHFSGGTP
jgi:hypothetical protein